MKHWMQDLVGAGLAVGAGLSVLSSHPFGGPLADWSYDLPYKFRPELSTGEIGLVSRDPGFSSNVPQPDTFDAYAAVLNRLIAQGARLVVLTEVFSERFGSDESRERFRQALRRARRGRAFGNPARSGRTAPSRGPFPADELEVGV